ncbi:hypothetical protein LMG27198_25840 [Methylocystis echinoides]|uniref:Uncharacterized protein n=1 Tax=Methylocystis echinoides TaxID=29468 RepID=A0A9W6LSK3_9HYPH|nr:hypothetical protein LMG27198_25840 [Methylocystis echinoides]
MTDRSAIMRQAWKEWRYARRRGWDMLEGPDRWDWARCLRFAAAQHRGRRDSFTAVEAAIRSLVAKSEARQ